MPVYLVENLGYGHAIEGPTIIMNGNINVVIGRFENKSLQNREIFKLRLDMFH